MGVVIVHGKPVMRSATRDDRSFVKEYTALAIKVGSVPSIGRQHDPSTQYRPR
jgi:hypothetical protein